MTPVADSDAPEHAHCEAIDQEQFKRGGGTSGAVFSGLG
jgi:hypothetical protein